MSTDPPTMDPQAYRALVARYKKTDFDLYKRCGEKIKEALEWAKQKIAPHAMVTMRPKSLASFAERIIRPGADCTDPFRQLTDLCGVRVVTHTPAEVSAFAHFLTRNLDVSLEDSRAEKESQEAEKTGYRTTHYIVFFSKYSPMKDVKVAVPEGLFGLKAEVQLRTLTEHCWADIGHDPIYKEIGTLPRTLDKKYKRCAEYLQDVNDGFAQLLNAVGACRTAFGRYMTKDVMERRLKMFQAALEDNADEEYLAYQVARLATCLQDWPEVERVLTHWQESDKVPLLISLGFALCQRHKNDPRGDDYRRGQGCLEKAVRVALGPAAQAEGGQHSWLACDAKEVLKRHSAEAIGTLADSWRRLEPQKVFEYYEKALDIDSSNPGAVVGYTVARMIARKESSLDPLYGNKLKEVLDTCQEQGEVDLDVPWIYYRIGEIKLLLSQDPKGLRPEVLALRQESLMAYAKAVQTSASEFMIDSALETLDGFCKAKLSLGGLDWVYRFLILARAARFPAPTRDGPLKELASQEAAGRVVKGRVRIVAGGYDCKPGQDPDDYLHSLRPHLKDFEGTVVSAGTPDGIGGAVARLVDGNSRVTYVPADPAAGFLLWPPPHEVRKVEGEGFSPLQPLQNWIDLQASGVAPADVEVIGIKGGNIARLEYRLALALGASVYVLTGKGGQEDQLFQDRDWRGSRNLRDLSALAEPPDRFSESAFGPGPGPT